MSIDRQTIASVRFGYGIAPDQIGPRDADDLMKELSVGQRDGLILPINTFAERATEAAKVRAELSRIKRQLSGDAQETASIAARKEDRALRRRYIADDARSLLTQRVHGRAFFERMSAFWADHFTANTRGRLLGAVGNATFEPEVIRPHLMGSFRDMLRAVSQNPVMLLYLDQTQSSGPKSKVGRRSKRGLNENLAREILELHTLGVRGPYTQKDVRQFALLLTGFGMDRRTGAFEFARERAEPGAKTVLGRVYGSHNTLPRHVFAALDDLAAHPATAEHLGWKLAVHFVSPEPPEDLVQHLKAAYLKSDGYLPAVYEALLEHPASWKTPLSKVKQPIDFVVALFRATGGRVQDFSDKELGRVFWWLKRSSQGLWEPKGPDGWPEEESYWITSAALANRFELAEQVARRLAKQPEADPRRFAEAALGSSLRPATAFAVGAAETREDGFAMIFSSPEFNRR